MRTIFNDLDLARAYKLAYRLCDAIGYFPWTVEKLTIEGRFYVVMERKYPKEQWAAILQGIRRHE